MTTLRPVTSPGCVLPVNPVKVRPVNHSLSVVTCIMIIRQVLYSVSTLYWSHNYYTIHYYFSIKKGLEVYGNKVLIIRLRTKTSSLISWTKKIELFPFTKSAAFDIMWQCLRNNFFYIDPVIFYINEAFVDYKLKFNVLLKKKDSFFITMFLIFFCRCERMFYRTQLFW